MWTATPGTATHPVLAGDPAFRGALLCPSCVSIHGGCADAIYPLMRLFRGGAGEAIGSSMAHSCVKETVGKTTYANGIDARKADRLHLERLLKRDRLRRVADVDDEFAGIHAPALCVHVVVAESAPVKVQDDMLCLAGFEADLAELLELH